MPPWIDPDDEYTGDEPQSSSSPGARNSDPWTSHAAAKFIEPTAKNQRGKLLAAYATTTAQLSDGLTDEEAQSLRPDVSRLSGFWKRCSELRQGGYIEPTGKTRKSHAGVDCIVCRITDKGTAALNKIRSEEF